MSCESSSVDKLELSDAETSAVKPDAGLEDYDEDLDEKTAEELERVKEECRTNKHVKPPYSYIALITMAVLQVCT